MQFNLNPLQDKLSQLINTSRKTLGAIFSPNIQDRPSTKIPQHFQPTLEEKALELGKSRTLAQRKTEELIAKTPLKSFGQWVKEETERSNALMGQYQKQGVWMPLSSKEPQFITDIKKSGWLGNIVGSMMGSSDEELSIARKVEAGENLTDYEKNLANQRSMDIAFGATTGLKTIGNASKLDMRKLASIKHELRRLNIPFKVEAKIGELRSLLKQGETSLSKNVGNVLTEMKGSQSAVSGLMTETRAQTATRRLAKIEPDQVYRGPLDNIYQKQGVDFDKYMMKADIPVKDKINIWDYLRTPDRVLKKLGLEKEANEMRLAWDKYLDELPQEIDKISQWAKRVPAESNRTVFKYLDGQITKNSLSPKELEVATEIQSYLAQFADRLRLPRDKRISSYITHIWEKDIAGREFPEEIAAIIRDKVPGSIYDPFVERRLGKLGYLEDTWRALDAYAKRGVRKANLDPVLERVRNAADGMEHSQFKYIKSYIDRVNLRPTEIDTLIDNSFKSVFGYRAGPRPVAALSRTSRRMVYRGLLGLNPSSALRNLSQGANNYAILGEKYTLKGYWEVAKNFRKLATGADTELTQVGVLRDGFIQDRALSATKQWLKKTDDGLWYMFNMSEKINRGAAYWGAKAKGLAQGMDERKAIEYAKKIVRDTQFTFGNIDTPVALQSDLAKTLAQFQTYTIKQGEFLGEQIASKNFAGIIRYIGANFLFMATIGKLFGFDVRDMVPSLRVGVPPTMQAPYGAVEALTTGETGNLTRGLINYIPAGGQIRKTVQGLQANTQGGTYTPSGMLRFPTEPTIQNALFGPNVSTAAKDYFQNPKPLGEKQTQTYQQLLMAGVPSQAAYERATQERNLDAKIKEATEPQGFNLWNFLTGKQPYATTSPTEPLFQILEKQQKLDADQTAIREVFKVAKSQEEAERLLKAVGYEGSYEDATYQVIKALEIPQRADYLKTLFSGTQLENFVELRNKLVNAGVFTNAVIDEWVDNGVISEDVGDAMKNGIKAAKGTLKPAKPKKSAKLSLGRISVPKGQTKLTIPKYNFKPLKLDTKKYNLKK